MPPKFVAPIRKSNGSGPSSSWSNSSFTQDAPVELETVKTEPQPGPSSKTSEQRVPNNDPLKKGRGFEFGFGVDLALQEKRKQDSTTATLPKPKKSKVGNYDDAGDDKENVAIVPKSSKKKKKDKDGPAIPCVSLSNEDYEKIFLAVLSRGKDQEALVDTQPEQVSQLNTCEDQNNENDAEPGDVSQDLFSKSDLEDSEDEVLQPSTPQKSFNESQSKSKELTEDESISCSSKERDVSTTSANVQEGSILDSPSVVRSMTPSSVKGTLTMTPVAPSPSVLFMCHSSQPTPGSQVDMKLFRESQDGNTQQEGTSSQGVSSDTNGAIGSPFLKKQSQNSVNLSPFVTPQKVSQSHRTSSVSQEIQASPSGSGSSTSRNNINPSPLVTPQKVSQGLKTASQSQEIQASPSGSGSSTSRNNSNPSPLVTPQRVSQCRGPSSAQQDLQASPASSLLKASQGSIVSASLSKKQSLNAKGSQPSQESQTPTRTTKSKSSINPSSAASSFCGSQKISQDLQSTPPPPNKTAKERLLWLQEKRLAGLWVQCDKEECGKWRFLSDCHDPNCLQEKWYCRMHPDIEQNQCDAQEKRLSLHAEEDMIFNKYSPGSLVWARLPGYPWWPAMVEDDPDLEQFYWLNLFSDIPTWYHVVFFDDKGLVTRAWIQVENLKDFKGKQLDFMGDEAVAYKRRLEAAFKKAHHAMALSLAERLAQYSFASCYKGAIGGSSKRLYKGPVGFREPVQK